MRRQHQLRCLRAVTLRLIERFQQHSSCSCAACAAELEELEQAAQQCGVAVQLPGFRVAERRGPPDGWLPIYEDAEPISAGGELDDAGSARPISRPRTENQLI